MIFFLRYSSFWERQNYRDSKNNSGLQGLLGKGEIIGGAQKIFGAMNIFRIMVDTCHYTFVQTHRIYNNKSGTNVKYGL